MPDASSVLPFVPDEPQWVEARGMLLSGRGHVRWADHQAALLYAPHDAIVSVVGAPPRRELEPLLSGVPPGTIALVAPEHRAAVGAFPGWSDSSAIVHTLADRRRRGSPSGAVRILDRENIALLAHVPDALRVDLQRALTFSPMSVACVDGTAVSFCYAVWQTESWYDISIDTLEGYRGRGLALAAARGLMALMSSSGKLPVWGALAGNEPSLRLARRLGFRPAAELTVLSKNI